MSYKNRLLEETKVKLKQHGKTLKDVEWIGTADGSEKIEGLYEFMKMADFDYNNGFGAIVIRPDLVVVGKGWWLERHEYIGCEWWEYKEQPKLQENPKKLSRLRATSEERATVMRDKRD